MFEKKAPKGSINTLKELVGESAEESNKEVIQTLTLIYGDGEEEEKPKKVDKCQEIMEFLKAFLIGEGSCKNLREFIKNVVSGKCCYEDKKILQRFRNLIEGKSDSNSNDGLQCLRDLLDGKVVSGDDKQLAQIFKDLVSSRRSDSINGLQCFKSLIGAESDSDEDKQLLQILKNFINMKGDFCDNKQLLEILRNLRNEKMDCNKLKKLLKDGSVFDNKKAFWTSFTIHGQTMVHNHGDSSVIRWVDRNGFHFLKPSSRTKITAPVFCNVWPAAPLDPNIELTFQYEVESAKTIHGSGLKVGVRPYLNNSPSTYFPSHPIIVQITSHETW